MRRRKLLFAELHRAGTKSLRLVGCNNGVGDHAVHLAGTFGKAGGKVRVGGNCLPVREEIGAMVEADHAATNQDHHNGNDAPDVHDVQPSFASGRLVSRFCGFMRSRPPRVMARPR